MAWGDAFNPRQRMADMLTKAVAFFGERDIGSGQDDSEQESPRDETEDGRFGAPLDLC